MRIKMNTKLRLVLGLFLLAVLNTALYAELITDNFNRSTLGSDWDAGSEFEILNDALTNTSTDEGWGHIAVFTPEADVTSAALVWDDTADTVGINNGGFVLMMDSPNSTANGYMLWRRTDASTIMLFTVSSGDYVAQVTTATATLAAPQAGDTYRVDITTDASGHHFACYLNGVLDGTISDVDKLEGNGTDLYAGLVLHGNRNNDIDSFSVTPNPPVPTTLQYISGDKQSADPSTQLANPFVVKVLDDSGNPVVGHTVVWAITSGGGSLQSPTTTSTASDGTASIYLTLGTTGSTSVTATAAHSGQHLSGSPQSFVASVESSGPVVKIMPLGADLTIASAGSGGYRRYLGALLESEGINADFVGSQDDGIGFDTDHEGHDGMSLADINTNVTGWLTAATPEVVLLMAGAAELDAGTSVAVTIDLLEQIIDKIYAWDSATGIVLSSVTPKSDGNNETIESLNRLIQMMYFEKLNANYDIRYAGQFEMFMTNPNYQAGYLSSGIYPNYNGYEVIAKTMVAPVMNIVSPSVPVVTDNFNRTSLTNTWLAAPEYVINGDVLENQAGVTGWDYLAIYQGMTNPTEVSIQIPSGVAPGDNIVSLGLAVLLESADLATDGYFIRVADGNVELWVIDDGGVYGKIAEEPHSGFSLDPGDFLKTAVTTNGSGHFFTVYFDSDSITTLSDPIKRKGNTTDTYAGLFIRGDQALQVDNFNLKKEFDITAPATVTDLSTDAPGANSVWLNWPAPGDDGAEGIVTGYDVRYSTGFVTEGTWDTALPAEFDKAPVAAGEAESFMVNGLAPNTPYYFAIKAYDEARNYSSISNMVAATTLNAAIFTDDFERSDLGDFWQETPGVEIQNGALHNSSAVDGWNYLGVYTGRKNPFAVEVEWSTLADLDGIGQGAIAVMLSAPTASASGYAIWYRTGNGKLYLWSLTDGALNVAVDEVDAVSGTTPGPGSHFKVSMRSDDNGHHFDCYVDDVFAGTVSDAAKTAGNTLDKYAGVVLHSQVNNDVESFSLTNVIDEANELVYVAGNNQTGTVMTALTDSLQFKVTDQNWVPIPNYAVDVAVTEGGGTLDLGSYETNQDGEIVIKWTLGQTSGSNNQRVVATASGLNGSPLAFVASAVPDEPVEISYVSGNNQEGAGGSLLPDSLVVVVTDQYGNPHINFPVTFSVTRGGGSTVKGQPVLTDPSGWASDFLILGTEDELTVVEAAAVYKNSDLTGSPIEFEARATSMVAYELRYVDGDRQTVPAGQILPDLIKVQVFDDEDNPIPNHKVYFSMLDGSATLDGGETLVEVRTDSLGYAAAEVTTGMTVEISHIQVNAFRSRVDLVGSPYTFGCYASTPDEYLEPLTPSSSFVGTQSNERAGYHLHTAGDVNGDGYDDFMIGTFHFKGENPNIPDQYDQDDTGAAYLILGKAVPNWGTDFSLNKADARFIGDDSYRSVGFYLAGGGDVNGDGYDDMIIGAPAGNDKRPNFEGSFFVVFGKASGDWDWDSKLYDMADASFDGENGQDNAGYSVAHIGDMNNDGYDDFIASAPFADNVREDDGSVYLFLGKAGGWSRQVGVENAAAIFKGNARHGAFGYCVDGVGDVNGDDIPDFVVGERGTGKVYLYFGRSSVNWGRDALASSTADVIFEGPEYTGFRVSRAGDVNGDGMNDILIGSIKADGSAGKTYLIWGRSDGSWDTDLENADVAFAGETAGDESSWDVQDAGDVNNDGFDDFMIGAWLNSQNGLYTGKMYLIKGKPFGWESEVQLSSVQEYFVGAHPVDHAGYSVARAGDINGDGWQDLLTSAAWADGDEPNAGIVYLFNNPSGIPMPGILSVDPDTMQFGNVYDQLEFVVRNVGGEDLQWEAIEAPDESWLYSISPTSGSVAAGDSQVVVVNVSRMGLEDGTYYGNISVADGAGALESVVVEMLVAPTPEYSVRLNAGGTDYTDGEGNLWEADRAYSAGRYGYVGGQTYSSSDPISGTSDDPLYQSERYGMSAYQFDVDPGSYTVTLLFAETYHQSFGSRVMSIFAEGEVVLEEFDIYAQAGHDAAIVQTFDNVIVADGTLDIEFSSMADDPKISAIYVTSNSTVIGMTIEPDSLDFAFDDVVLSLIVTNDGDVPLEWSAIELPETSWITGISPESGTIVVTGEQQITVSVDRAGLSEGDYSAGIRITSNAGSQDIPVEMSVSGVTELSVDPEELAFSTNNSSMSFTITNIGKETFNWVAAENPEQIWITGVSPSSGQLGISQSAVVTVDVNRFGLDEGTYGSFIQVLATGSEADTAQVAISMDVTSYEPYSQRINAGGSGYTDTAGNFWAADQVYTAGGFGYDGGGTYATSDPIDNTNDDPLYQTERYGMAAYHFDVSAGTYQVTLHFAENYYRTTGRRIMNVSIEDLPVLTNLDLVQMAGHDVAVSFNYPEITVDDGRLDITFSATKDAAKISAIEITSIASMPVFAISPDTLDFGAGKDVINMTIWNAGDETMAWSATESPETGWITGIQPSGGTLSPGVQATLEVTVNRDGMLEGDYESVIQFVSNGGTENVPVYMRVVGGPALAIEPKIVDFGLEEVNKSFTIANSGGGELDWELVELDPESWLTLTGSSSGSLDMDQSTAITVSVSRSGMSDGDYLATLAVYTQVDTQYVAVSMVVQNRAPYSARINAGGGQYTDVAGNSWTADQAYVEDSFGYVGGYNYSVSDGITNTEDDPLYQSERYGMTSYKFDVPVGQYNVALHFAEIYAKRVGLRVMDVKIEGSTVLDDLDLYAVAGHKVATVYNFENIVVTDGTLEISFLKVKDDTKISAISVQEISSDPILAVTPDTLNFGSDTEQLLLTINNSGMDALSWTATENPDYEWIQEVSPTSGTALSGMRQIIAVQVDRENLSQGTHTGLIRIGSNGGVKNVPVIVTVPGPPNLDVNVTSLDFGDKYSLLTFDVTNVGGGSVDWEVAETPDATWITNIAPLTGTLNTGETSTVAVEVSRSGMAEGDYIGRLKVSNTADVADTAGIAVSMTAVKYAPYAQRINAGGGNYTDKAGHFWQADQAYVVGGFGSDGGGTYTKNDPIAGTEDDLLYQSEHYGMSAYRFDVSPGSYQVTLHFAEIYHRYPNKRMMTIQLEGNEVLNDLDLVAEAGHDVAYVQTFSGITVTDGRLDIQFEAVKDDPKISAIEVSSISTDPILAVQPDTLDFGSAVDELLVNITNSGKGYLVWNAAEATDLSWITSIDPASGTLAEGASETVKVTVNRQGLSQGDYRGTVEISSNGGSEIVTVMAKVPGPAQLLVQPVSLDFGTDYAELPLYVKNTGGGSLSWSAAENPDMSWLVSMSAISGTLAADEVDTVLVTVSRSGMAEEAYTGQISVSSDAGSANVAVHMTVVDFPPYTQRINAGGDSHTDGAGHLWAADRAYSAGSFGFVGGEIYHSRDDVANTDDDELYQSERYGMDAYRFDVRAGTYQVILHFAETYHRSAGKRVFSVMAEGIPIVENLDIFARAGHDAAMSITSSEFYITDGSLDLTFAAIADDPKISAIEVTSIMTDPILSVSPDSLIFGSIKDTLQTTIRNTGRNTLNWSMADLSSSSWISEILPSSGSVGSGLFQKVVVEVSRSGLDQADYNGLIRLSSNAGSVDMPVKMRVPGPAALAVNVDTLNFGDSERTLTFALSNQGAGTVSWSLAENPEKVWITSISNTSGTLQPDEVTYVAVTVARYGQNEGDYTGLISITSDAGNDDIVVNMTVVDLPPYTKRINTGGRSYQDGDGNIWVADQAYTPEGFGYVGGGDYQVSYSISHTDDEVLFQSEHFGMEAYRFTVPDGWYNVALLFAENYYREAGRRVMDVFIEGQPVLESFDIFKESGGRNYAMEQVFTDVFVQDGVLDISFTGLVEEAKISAIAIGSFNKTANLVIETDSLNYGVGLDTLYFEIANSGNASLSWTIDPIAPESWITQIVPMSGSVAESSQQEVRVIIDRGELTEDDYTDNIHVSSNGGTDDLLVTMSVPGPPTLVVSPPDLNFDVDESCFTFQVRNAGGGSLAWSAAESPEKSWITTVNPAAGSLETGKSATVTVCLDRDGLDEGDYFSQIKIVGVGVEPDTQYVSISMRVEKVPPYTMRVNAGGGNYTDVSGLSWTADQAFAVGAYGYVAGEPGQTYDNISNTDDDILYQTERFGMEAYRFEVPEGTYEITLHFAEIYATWTGRRLMSVTIEGIPVLEDFDIYQAVGHDAAVVRSYSNILVTDGVLDVEFSASKEDAKISAIEITAYENEPVLSVAPDTLDFGSVMDTLAVLVTNTGRQTLNWSVTEDPDESWLTKVLPTAGSLPAGANQAVSVIVDREEIETIGEHFTRLNFASNGGSRSIPIRIKKPGPALLLVTPLALDFGTSENLLTFQVKNDGGDTLVWSAGENPDQTWITAINPPAGELGPDDSRTVSVQISREELEYGDYSGIIRIVTESDSAEIAVEMEVASGPLYVQRVNCGRMSTSYTDQNGNIFDPDQAYETGSWGYLGGSIYSNTDPISDTYDDPLYQSERWGLDGYKFDVTDGVYEVTLHFAELYYTAAGQRVFHVDIEGTRKIANYDIYQEVGHKAAAKKVFLITVGDDQLNIVFSRAKDYPKISAIEVVRAEAYNMTKSAVAEAEPVIPESFELHQNFPNPFNPETEIRYELPFAAAVKLTIFNIRGERVAVLQDQAYEAGMHATVWDARDEWGQGVASGIYFYQIRVTPADNRKKPLIEIRKMTYCK